MSIKLDAEPASGFVPLIFDSDKGSTQSLLLDIDYAASDDSLEVGGKKFNGQSITVDLQTETRDVDDRYVFTFSWPKSFLDQGKIEILNAKKSGDVLFTSEFDRAAISEFVKGSTTSQETVFSADQAHLERKVGKEELARFPRKASLKFCVAGVKNNLAFKLCSPSFSLRKKDGVFQIKLTKVKPRAATVAINEKLSATAGKFTQDFSQGRAVFDIKLSSGSTYFFEVGRPPAPPTDVAAQKFFDANGFLWRQNLKLLQVTTASKVKANLIARSPHQTYSNHVLLHGFSAENLSVSSVEFEAHTVTPETFDWDFKSDESGVVNRKSLFFSKDSKDKETASYEVYRGYPYEIETHWAALLTDSSAVVLQGELTGSAWLEQVFKSENYFFSRHRWGATVSYGQSVVNSSNQYGRPAGFSNFNTYLNYRIIPTVNHHEESFGVSAALQNIAVNSLTSGMLGVSIFWERPLFTCIDGVINFVRPLRFPKVIDARADYFFSSISSTTLGGDFNLAANLKLFLRADFYAEAGVAYKSFDFTSTSNRTTAKETFFYGTLGAGKSF